MPFCCLQGALTKESLKSIIEINQNIEEATRAITESVGKNLLFLSLFTRTIFYFIAVLNMAFLHKYMPIF